MVRVQVNSSASQGLVGKLSNEARGPFRVVEDYSNGSNSVQPFDKPDSAVRKFQTQNIYALPPQILQCDDFDLPDLMYLNTDVAPVKYSFKDNFNIKSCKRMCLDNTSMITKQDLIDLWKRYGSCYDTS